ncbi:MAG: ABC transporter ATP-binding protein [Clostridia bacterium]|nr:ABC transporter ATP-binding protein [Clostridia bacterium]
MKIRISKEYDGRVLFDDFSLEIEEGKILCVLGASGVGKTTLLNALSGLAPFQGEKEGVPASVGYVFQSPRLLPNLTVEQNLRYAGGRDEDIVKILEKTELTAHKAKRPKQLSGGEKQRVAIARAFLQNAPLLLLDEPFSSLDTALKIRLSNVLAGLWKELRPTTVFVTHDLEDACMLAHRIVVLKDGKIAADVTLKEGELPRVYGEESAQKAEILRALLES